MTMNLIQQQTAAKDLPLQYLQQAVNGQNPNLTPWIATAELQRRTTMDQHMQKGQQGPMPTVKDQVEQKAGLMATQAAQQAQGAQMQQSAPPQGPIPQGIPQPEAQPEPPVHAAHGGLMDARTNLHFAHGGGIMGFAGDDVQGSDVPDPTVRQPNESLAAYRQRLVALQQSVPDQSDAETARLTRQATPVAPAVAATKRPPTGNPLAVAAAQKAASPDTSADSADQSPFKDAALKYLNMPAPDTTAASAMAQQDTFANRYGTAKPIGDAQEAYWKQQDALQQQRQDQAKKLAWSAYVQGTVGTPGSGALAYDTTMANAGNQAGTYSEARLKNIADLEAARHNQAMAQQTGAQGILSAAQTRAMEQAKGQGQAAMQGYDAQQQNATSRYNNTQTNATNIKIAQLQAQARTAEFGIQNQQMALQNLKAIAATAKSDVDNFRAQYAQAYKLTDKDEMARVKPFMDNAQATYNAAMQAQAAASGVKLPDMTPTMSPVDKQALDWANSNPKDPRAAQIKQRLGV